jgi:hypothetical protein
MAGNIQEQDHQVQKIIPGEEPQCLMPLLSRELQAVHKDEILN